MPPSSTPKFLFCKLKTRVYLCGALPALACAFAAAPMDINFLTRVESHAGDLFSLGLQGQTLPSIKSHETLDRAASYENPPTVPAADASSIRNAASTPNLVSLAEDGAIDPARRVSTRSRWRAISHVR